MVKLSLYEQNKIWELLTQESKDKILSRYKYFINNTWDGNRDSYWQGEIEILEDTYGYHNLNDTQNSSPTKITASQILEATHKFRSPDDETRCPDNLHRTIGYLSINKNKGKEHKPTYR